MENYRSLPDALVTKILVRLPVESLARFKCVRKNWYWLITTSSFVREHLNHLEKNPTRLLLHFRDIPSQSSTSLLLPEKILPGVISLHEKPSYLQIPAQLTEIIGPVDGIYFLYKKLSSDNRMALWNPTLREFRPLPPYNIKISMPRGHFRYIFGFGFDPLSQVYKVVYVMIFCNLEEWNNDRVFAAVYSLGKDCWRNLACRFDNRVPSCMENSLCSTCVNGVYYWSTLSSGAIAFQPLLLIRYFNMQNEVFGEIPGPKISCVIDGLITLYKESIALLVRNDTDDFIFAYQIDVWLMSNERSWTKVLNVVPTIPNSCPIGLWGHDKIILYSEDEALVISDSKTHEITRLLDSKIYGRRWALSYKESLVSIKSKNIRHKQSSIFDLIQEFFKDE
ncbi:F-box/kelch-repeat protein At3g23880-like [Nicotiana tabacum]|uniref:F-box protein At3g08750-like n=1 Tax=Nicotiana tabacum TaxID=4097 RepID=A0A1S3Z5Y8_TOBAC|nr:PREDICTED: F-box protein At3g08750-like [Nicotiana tabacum]